MEHPDDAIVDGDFDRIDCILNGTKLQQVEVYSCWIDDSNALNKVPTGNGSFLLEFH